MLSYQHAFHAGNHADVLKHYVLSFVLNSLNKKEKPYTFFDTHSASGLYDLLDNRLLKTEEAEKGIVSLEKKIEKASADSGIEIPGSFLEYLSVVKTFTEKKLYPGSPKIEEYYLRPQDFLVLSEIHPQEIENLKNNFKNTDKNVQIHNRSGWEMIKALTPPATKRGGVLIDPSYEEKQDYEDAASVICSVYKKWSNGIILLWYPLLAHRENEILNMKNKIISFVKDINPNTEINDFQLQVFDKDAHKEVELQQFLEDKKNPPRLYGSGMFVINTPWKLAEDMEAVVKLCQSIFYCS